MSKLSDAAYAWLIKHQGTQPIATDALWTGMRADYPDLTVVNANRKTPRTTLRDLRLDRKKRFVVANRSIKLYREG